MMQHQAIPDLVAYLSETIEEIETHGADTKTEEHVYAKKDDFFLMILKRNDRLLAQLCDPSTDFEILELSVGIETYNDCRAIKNVNPKFEVQLFSILGRIIGCIFMINSPGKSILDSIDILRTIGRTGSALGLILEKPSDDESPVQLKRKENLSTILLFIYTQAMTLWKKISLSHLTRLKTGLELEAILEDIWDLVMKKLELSSSSSQSIIDAPISQGPSFDYEQPREKCVKSEIEELEQLLPYLQGYRHLLFQKLLDLATSSSPSSNTDIHTHDSHIDSEKIMKHKETGDENDETMKLKNWILQKALQILESGHVGPEALKEWKKQRHVILNELTQSYLYLQDVQATEKCLEMLMQEKPIPITTWFYKLQFEMSLRQEDDIVYSNEADRCFQQILEYPDFHEVMKSAEFILSANIALSSNGQQQKHTALITSIYDQICHNFPEKQIAVRIDQVNYLLRKTYSTTTGANCPKSWTEIAHEVMEDLIQKDKQARLGASDRQLIQQSIHEASCLYFNREQYLECLDWCCQGLTFVLEKEDQSRIKRIMSKAQMALEHVDQALTLANEALQLHQCTLNVFIVFQVHLRKLTANRNTKSEIKNQEKILSSLLSDLLHSPDFCVEDLGAFGNEARKYNQTGIMIEILRELSSCLLQQLQEPLNPKKELPLPFGVVIQHLMQLTQHAPSTAREEEKEDKKELIPVSSSSPSILAYGNLALQGLQCINEIVAEKRDHQRHQHGNANSDDNRKNENAHGVNTFGSSIVLEWIHGACHNEGILNKDFQAFHLASKLAQQGQVMFPSVSATTNWKQKQSQSLLVSISLQMELLEDLEIREVQSLLSDAKECYALFQLLESSSSSVEDEIKPYLVKVIFLLKIRTGDLDLEKAFEHSKAILQADAEGYILLGAFCQRAKEHHALDCSNMAAASEIQSVLNTVSLKCFQFSLQLYLQQQDSSEHQILMERVVEIFQKLIEYSPTKQAALDWMEHFFQLATTFEWKLGTCQTSSSEDSSPSLSGEWFLAKIWNLGVSCIRIKELKLAKKFLTLAINFMETITPELIDKWGSKLHEQFAYFNLGISSSS